MTSPSRFGIQAKVVASLSALVACLVAYFSVSTLSARENVGTLRRASDEVFPALQAADSNIFQSERLKESLNAAVGTREIDELANADTIAAGIRDGFATMMKRDAASAPAARAMLIAFDQYYTQARELSAKLIKTNDFGDPAIVQGMSTMTANAERFASTLKSFRTQRNDQFTASINDAGDETARVISVGYVLLLVSLLTFAFTLFRMRRDIVLPIVDLSGISQLVAKGQFPALAARASRDEIGVLYANFGAMIGEIRASQENLQLLVAEGRKLAAATTAESLSTLVSSAFAAVVRMPVTTELFFANTCFLDPSLAPGYYRTDASGDPLQASRRTEDSMAGHLVWVVDPKSEGRLAAIVVHANDAKVIAKSMSSFSALATNVASAIAAIRLERAMDVIAAKTRQVQTILAHVSFGLLICDKDLRVMDGYSAACHRLLGDDASLTGKSLASLLGMNARSTDHFLSIYQESCDPDCLFPEITLDQLPTRFAIGRGTLGLAGSLVKNAAGEAQGVLFCLSDITPLVAAETLNEENSALIKMLTSRDSFRQFVADAKTSLETMLKDETTARRELHTLKGNSGAFGLTGLARRIHEVEDGDTIRTSDLNEIEGILRTFLETNQPLLGVTWGVAPDDTYTVPARLVDAMEQRAAAAVTLGDQRAVMAAFCRDIRLKQARNILGPIDTAVQDIARRLGKRVQFTLNGGDTLIPKEAIPVLRTLTHLIRNSVDHGIEDEGAIDVRIEDAGSMLRIVVQDNGRGIPASALSRIFDDGFSTATAITDISGRGVGLSAVKAAIEQEAGTIAVASVVGQGTTFTIELPAKRTLSLPSATAA